MEEVVEGFVEVWRSLVKREVIARNDLTRHTGTNTHAYMVYSAIEACRRSGYEPIPEYKVRFAEPLSLPWWRRGQWFAKVDVACFNGSWKFKGVVECFTVDEADHALRSTSEKHGARDYERLTHLAKQVKLDFILLVVVLPKSVEERPKWNQALREAPSNFLSHFRESWEGLARELGRFVGEADLIILTEECAIGPRGEEYPYEVGL